MSTYLPYAYYTKNVTFNVPVLHVHGRSQRLFLFYLHFSITFKAVYNAVQQLSAAILQFLAPIYCQTELLSNSQPFSQLLYLHPSQEFGRV